MSKILYIDAVNASSWYNYSLNYIFSKRNFPVLFLTSKFLWDPEFPPPPNTEIFFFNYATKICEKLNLSQKARQILRAVEYPLDLFKLYRFIKKHDIKLVHFNWSRMPLLDYAFMRFLQKKQVETIYTAHNFLPHDSGKKYFNRFKRLYRQSDKIITLTDFVKDEIVQQCQIAPNKISVIPHTNYSSIINICQSKHPLKKKTTKHTMPEFLFWGAILPYKGLDDLLKAFAIVQKHYPDCKLKVYGKLSIPFSAIEKLIAEYQIEASGIEFKFNFFPMCEAINYLNCADVVVLPYKRSSQSGVIPLLTTLGIPVIATRVGGIPEMIIDYQNGFLVPPENPKALAQKMIEIIENPSVLESLSKSIPQACEALFSDDMISDKFKTIYKL
jgi:glycosyltransferase involved in cell wall biosynthesis